MKKISLKCRVVTPLFMGGAEMKPEIRTQSIKGTIRFWWRALKAYHNIIDLRNEEFNIFGGRVGQQAVASKVKLDIMVMSRDVGDNLRTDFKLNWGFDRGSKSLTGQHFGIGYLLFSVLNKPYFKPGVEFNIRILSRDENALKNTLAALWCNFYLGGMGSRSRRGAGSVIVEEIENNITDLDFTLPKDSIVNWYKSNLKKCFNIVNGSINGNCYYSNLVKAKLIISHREFSDWSEALNDIGKTYHDFRKSNRHKIFKVAAFGLPIIHAHGRVLTNRKDIQRRSSPIIFRIIGGNNKYYWVSLWLGGKFLPDKVKISFNNKEEEPDLSMINEFWQTIKKNNVEIDLWEVFNA